MPDDAKWINSNQRLHHQARARYTRAWRRAALEAVLPGTRPFDPSRRVLITGHVWKPSGPYYDPMNLYPTGKACVDGFVQAGLLADDDWKHVLGPLMDHGGLSAAPRVIFTLEELP